MKLRPLVSFIGLTLASLAFLFVVALVVGGGANEITLSKISTGTRPGATGLQKTVNLTETVTARVIEGLSKSPISAPEESSTAVANLAFINALNNFDAEDLRPIVERQSFLISHDTSPASGQNYIKNLLSVIQSTAGTIPPDPKDPKTPDFAAALQTHIQAVDSLYALQVPIHLIEIHRDAIALIGMQRNILHALSMHNTDPLRSYMAAQYQQKTSKDMETLSADIIEYLERVKTNRS